MNFTHKYITIDPKEDPYPIDSFKVLCSRRSSIEKGSCLQPYRIQKAENYLFISPWQLLGTEKSESSKITEKQEASFSDGYLIKKYRGKIHSV